jgi:hypothetical protein
LEHDEGQIIPETLVEIETTHLALRRLAERSMNLTKQALRSTLAPF